MATADLHHGRIKTGNGMAFLLRRPDERVRHGEAVAVFAGTSGDHYDFFTHGRSSPNQNFPAALILPAACIIIVAQAGKISSTHIRVRYLPKGECSS